MPQAHRPLATTLSVHKKRLFGYMKKTALSLLLALGSLFASSAQAANAPPTADYSACWHGAAQYHQVDVWLLYSIGWVESGFNPNAVNRNKNGSVDLGAMQINTIWLKELQKYGITERHLMDGCTSVYVGAWILSKSIKRYGYTWRAIGAYNSATPSIGFKYAKKVYAAHQRITGLPST